MTTGLDTEARPRRLGRLALALAALALAGSTAFLTWWTTTLHGLPDVGDPFDVAAFERPIPDDSNAFVLYKQAAALVPKAPPNLTVDWNTAAPAERRWLEASQEALKIWREGTERPDALDILPHNLTFETKLDVAQALRNDFTKLAQLQGGKLEAEGDVAGALEWYLALLRSSRHSGRRGGFIERVIGCAMGNIACARLTRWAASPIVDARMLRQALNAVYAAEAATPPASDGLKAEYLSVLHSLDDPELMVKMLDYEVVPDNKGGSTTLYGQHQWKSNLIRVRRRALNEPERSRRVIRLVFANWLAYCDRPPGRRPPKALPNPVITGKDPYKALLSDLFATDASAPGAARALPPEKVARWFASTIDAEAFLPAYVSIDRAVARERSTRGNLLVALANELHKREHGHYPEHNEDLVGPYLKVAAAEVIMPRRSEPEQAGLRTPPASTEPVQRHGRDDDRADDHVLAGVGDAGVDAAVVQDRHDQAADQGAEDGPLAAAQAPAADHHGGDHLEFQAVGGGRVAGPVQEEELEAARQAGQQPRQAVDRPA